MRNVLMLYRYVNLLSLDIVAGAIISAVFFAGLLGVTLLPYALIALGLTVWIIYTADHLRDAKRIGPNASSERHSFHYRHFRILTRVMIIVLAVDAIVILFLRSAIFTAGIYLSLIVAAYLVAHRYLKWAKEIFVAALYACGVLLPSVAIAPVELSNLHSIAFVIFGILALINLLMLSWFDYETDLRDHQQSFATIMGRDITHRWIFILIGVNFACTAFLLQQGFEAKAAFILMAMNVLLLIIFLFPAITDRNNSYRLVGDAAFLIPAIYLL